MTRDLVAELATFLGKTPDQIAPPPPWNAVEEDQVAAHLTACDGCRRCGWGRSS